MTTPVFIRVGKDAHMGARVSVVTEPDGVQMQSFDLAQGEEREFLIWGAQSLCVRECTAPERVVASIEPVLPV